jgi:long-chain acyl-CoA synthetase
MHTHQSLVHMVLNSCLQNPNQASMSMREHDHWKTVSKNDLFDSIRHLSLGINQLKLDANSGIAIMCPSSPDWILIDLAIQSCGHLSVPMFPNISSENFLFEIINADVKAIFIDCDQEISDEIRSHLNQIPFQISLKKVIDSSLNLLNLIQKGKEIDTKSPELYQKMIEKIHPNHIATIIYTSGSTGLPKGVEITHANLLYQTEAAKIQFPLNQNSDISLSCLPLAHVFERMVIYYYLSCGIHIYFADDIQKTAQLAQEIKPQIITLVPRVLEKVYTKILQKSSDERGLKKIFLRFALSRIRNRQHPNTFPFAHQFFDKLVYKKLRMILGGNIRLIISGGAALNPKILHFFLNAGFPIYEGYGLTESSPVISANCPHANRPESVGLPFPNTEIRISEDGEILAKGPGISPGYHKIEEALNKTFDHEWLHTGDLGEIDKDGYLYIKGRKKELFKTSNGKYVSPTPIENSITANTDLIEHALVIADGKKYVSCLLWPDWDHMCRAKKKRKLNHLNDLEFIHHEQFSEDIDLLISKVNQKLNHWEQIRKYILIPNRLSIENGDLTPKMNIRRVELEKKYEFEILKLYPEN